MPVEIAVERELGFDNKSQIEEYGVAKFNELCRSTVFRHILEWEKFTERIAFWVNMDDAYVTFANEYIESVWWILKQFWDKGLLYRGYKVVPYSPTSGTPLSSHEVSLGYKSIVDPSIYARFPAPRAARRLPAGNGRRRPGPCQPTRRSRSAKMSHTPALN